jgi:hypothetical protein
MTGCSYPLRDGFRTPPFCHLFFRLLGPGLRFRLALFHRWFSLLTQSHGIDVIQTRYMWGGNLGMGVIMTYLWF